MVKRYDFDCYAFYDSARMSINECDDGDYVLHSDYAALLARHNALRYNTKVIIMAYRENRTRHNALVEAVAWERECFQDIRPLVAWADLYVRHGEDYVDSVADDLRAIQDAARAAVDTIVKEL